MCQVHARLMHGRAWDRQQAVQTLKAQPCAHHLLFELLQHAVDLPGLVLVCRLFAGQLKHRLQPVRGV
jgi:hypothetical protein